MDDRIRELIDMVGIDALVRATEIGGTRWRTVRYDKRTRVSTAEAAALAKLYPQYGLWLISGEIAPEIGQTSPAYDEANDALKQQGGA